MTIGDVLAVVFFVIGLWISSWAVLVGVALLFPARAAASQSLLAKRPWRAIVTGAIVAATAGLVAIFLINQPSGLGKLVGWAGLAVLFGIATLGAAGLSRLLGERLSEQHPSASGWSTLARGAGLLIVSGLVPLLGWFAIVPLSIVASLGAGWLALWKRTGEKKVSLIEVVDLEHDSLLQSTLEPTYVFRPQSTLAPPATTPNGSATPPVEMTNAEALR